uniref:glutathione transferase n=1 Tax=Cannabis sativa TaxID=3483 RepID=A0A803NQJ6_CANSA
MAVSSNTPSTINLTFSHDRSFIAACTETGVQLFSCDPFRAIDLREEGGISTVEFLFGSNIWALVGGGTSPEFDRKKVRFWENAKNCFIGEISCRSVVLSVRMRRDFIFVVLENRTLVYNYSNLKIYCQIETAANPKGLCAASVGDSPAVMVCLGVLIGEIRVEHYSIRKIKFIAAHSSEIACLGITREGSLVATASVKGTVIRVFRTRDGTLLQELWRGTERATIYSLAFSSPIKWLAVSSDTGTVHIFNLNKCTTTQVLQPQPLQTSYTSSSLSFIKGLVMPNCISLDRSLAKIRLVKGSKYIADFGHMKNTIIVLGMDGSALENCGLTGSYQPFGQVPVLEDGDLTLFESRAINEYLAEKFKDSGHDLLRSENLNESAIVKVWREVESHQYDPLISSIVFQHFVAPLQGKEPDQKIIDENLDKLGKVLDIYEAKLSETKYLAGDFYTLPDLHHLPYTFYFMKTPWASLINDRAHVKAWWDDISSRPAFEKVAQGMTFDMK